MGKTTFGIHPDVYDEQFYALHEPLRAEYNLIAHWIHHRWRPSSTADLGCGNAFILSQLRKLNPWMAMAGVDASAAGQAAARTNIPPQHVYGHDLRQPLPPLGRLERYDLVVCLEVAEHLEPEFADQLVDSITRLAARWVLFSAGRPGQDGVCHVNLQPPSYWWEKFSRRGWTLDATATAAFQFALASRFVHAQWFATNVMVFVPLGQRG